MSFLNLFGGDKKLTSTTTENTSIDNSVTKSNADNVSNWLQQNLAQIQNTTDINNTNLENTDSFNRTQLHVLADVGNISPGTPVSPVLDSVGIQNIFNSVLRSPVFNANTVSKDTNQQRLNMDQISKVAVDVIDSSGRNQLGTYFEGVSDLSRATSPTYAGNSSTASPLNSPWFWPIAGAVLIFGLFMAFRRSS